MKNMVLRNVRQFVWFKRENEGVGMIEKVFAKCGMRCDLCLIYRPYVAINDRRNEVCKVYEEMHPGYKPDPKTIICDGCMCEEENAILLEPTCRVRKCVQDKGYVHCGYCEEYPCEIFPAEPSYEELVQIIDVEKKWTWEEQQMLEAYNCKNNMDEFRKSR